MLRLKVSNMKNNNFKFLEKNFITISLFIACVVPRY